MTDWRTLEAGPELDAIVAERVFGLDVRERDAHDWQNEDPGWWKCTHCAQATDWLESQFGKSRCRPSTLPYSTTWEGMGLVVERMRELKFYIGIHDEMDGYTVDFCVGPDEDGDLVGVSRADAGAAPDISPVCESDV